MADGETRRPVPMRVFTDHYDWMGPLIVALASWYFLAQVVVAWVFNPGREEYSFVKNTISDLGNTACGPYGGSYVCSPRNDVMNASLIALGLAMAVGAVLIYTEFAGGAFRERWAAIVAFVLMGIGGVGAALVGASPENTNGDVHALGAGLAIGGGTLAMIVLGLVLVSIPEGLRHFMLIAGGIAVVAAVSFAFKHHFGLGAGGMERIAQYPESVWLIMFGLYITRDHYRRGLTRNLRFVEERPLPV